MDCKGCKVRSSRRTEVKGKTVRVDKCMVDIVNTINEYTLYETLGCCCGHGIYPMSIVVRDKSGYKFDLMSGKEVPRKTRYYVTDDKGFYYIPEIISI